MYPGSISISPFEFCDFYHNTISRAYATALKKTMSFLREMFFSRQLFHCLHSEKPFTASLKCLGLNMRAITHWCLLPKPLSTDEAWHIFFLKKSQILSSVFRVSRPCVTSVQRQRTRGVPENQILHFYSVNHSVASISAVEGFFEGTGGKKKGTQNEISEHFSTFPGRTSPKVTVPIHTPIYIE